MTNICVRASLTKYPKQRFFPELPRQRQQQFYLYWILYGQERQEYDACVLGSCYMGYVGCLSISSSVFLFLVPLTAPAPPPPAESSSPCQKILTCGHTIWTSASFQWLGDEPRHGQTNKKPVRPAKTQINPDVRDNVIRWEKCVCAFYHWITYASYFLGNLWRMRLLMILTGIVLFIILTRLTTKTTNLIIIIMINQFTTEFFSL